MSLIESRLKDMGITLPDVPKPVAAYVPGVLDGDHVYVSGQIPMVDGALAYVGHAGAERTLEEAYEAAKVCALNCLAVVKSLVGDLDRVEHIVKLTGFVSSAPGFNDQSAAVNGASELLAGVFGEKGTHARSAVGVTELPRNALTEVEIIVKVKL